MTRYALIDNASGFVWGVTDAESPLEACQIIDDETDGDSDSYTYEAKAGPDGAFERGYHVYEAPQGEFDDGMNEETIAAVLKMPKAGYFAVIGAYA